MLLPGPPSPHVQDEIVTCLCIENITAYCDNTKVSRPTLSLSYNALVINQSET